MRNYKIKEQVTRKLKPMKKEHNGPDGHRIPDNFGKIAKNLQTDTLRSPVISSYNTGEMLMEGDLEGYFSQKGDDAKNYPQLSAQDYSPVRKDSKGKYVVKSEVYNEGSSAGIEKRKK